MRTTVRPKSQAGTISVKVQVEGDFAWSYSYKTPFENFGGDAADRKGRTRTHSLGETKALDGVSHIWSLEVASLDGKEAEGKVTFSWDQHEGSETTLAEREVPIKLKAGSKNVPIAGDVRFPKARKN